MSTATRTGARSSAASRGPSLWWVTLGFQVLLLAFWEGAARAGTLASYVVPPSVIVLEAATRITDLETLQRVLHSLYRALVGFALGSAIGVVLGLLSGVSRVVRDLLDTTQAFVHAIPKISLFPAVAVWLGFSDAARILIISLSCFFPAYLNAMSGALGINPRYLALSRNNEIGAVQTFLQVVIPASLPRTLVGLRISLMVAFILMVATEVVGDSDGLGSFVMRAYQDGNYAQMYAGILYIALAGFVANDVLQRVSRRLCRGQNLETGALS